MDGACETIPIRAIGFIKFSPAGLELRLRSQIDALGDVQIRDDNP